MVANFSPSYRFNLKGLPSSDRRPDELFSLIFAVDAMDLLVDPDSENHLDGSYGAHANLFRNGRLLWGSLMDYGRPLERILTGFVDSKLRSGEESTKALALLSYRMSFYVVNNVLAEELVSKHFQYVLYANGARGL